MNILGIIPARGGSKAIPRKNLALLAGKPLLAYTCEAARQSKLLTRTIVSTDDAEIAAFARGQGMEVFIRPASLAEDDTPMLDVLVHLLVELEQKKYSADAIVLLQPTSPLRTTTHIDEAIRLLQSADADSVVSVVEAPHQFTPGSLMQLQDGWLESFSAEPAPTRRQDKPKFYGRNGPAVLAAWGKTILEKKSLYGSRIRPLFMKPEESIDVDTTLDLKLAACLLHHDA